MQTAYTSYFGFSDKPFKFKPDPRFFYHNPNFDNAFSAVVKGLHERKRLIVLTGESGTGKTTLLHKCRSKLDANFRIIHVPNTLPSINSFLSHIGKSLNLDICDDSNDADVTLTITKIKIFLASQAQQGQATVVIIEDAQNMVDSVLAGILDLSKTPGAQESRLQFIMLGSPELDKKLRSFNLPAEESIYCHLAPLQGREINAFIQYQIQAANYQGNDLFSSEIIDDIVCYSKGIPRLINTLCDSALLIASRQNQKIITKTILEEAARRCYLSVDLNVGNSKTQPLPLNNHSSKQHRQPVLDKSSSHASSSRETHSGVPMNRRWLWIGIAATTTLIFIGSALFFQQYRSVTPSAATLHPMVAVSAPQPANTVRTTAALEKVNVSPPVAIRPAPSQTAPPQKTTVAPSNIATTPQYKTATTTTNATIGNTTIGNATIDNATIGEVPNTFIELAGPTTAESIDTPRNSTPQNNDIPYQPFTAFEETSSTANFHPPSSNVFVEMRGSNKEVFDSAGRVKSLITRKDANL